MRGLRLRNVATYCDSSGQYKLTAAVRVSRQVGHILSTGRPP